MLCKFHLKINNQWSAYFLFSRIYHRGRDCIVRLFMRQFHCNANCEFQTEVFYMIMLDVFSDFCSVESEFCIEEKYGIKLALVPISYVTLS